MQELHDILIRVWENLVVRPSGPLGLRFLIQPAVAILLATRDGIKDARIGRSPYLWTILTDPAQRQSRLREGIAAVSKVMILALILDSIYQYKVMGRFYPGEMLIVVLALAFLPYLLVRGPAERIARRMISRKQQSSNHR